MNVSSREVGVSMNVRGGKYECIESWILWVSMNVKG